MATKATLTPTVATLGDDKWWGKTKAVPDSRVQQKIIQTITFKLGSFDDKNRTFRAIASTSIEDRQGDVLEQNGWDLANFIANPVIPWCHDYYQPPVARATEIGVADGVLQFTYQAPPKGIYEFADTIWDLYRNGFMFAFSVGFIPKKKDGSDIGWDDYDWDGNVWEAAELLEVSAVVVPANPQALALSQKSGIVNEKAAKSLIEKTAVAMKHLEEDMKSAASLTDKQDAEIKVKVNADTVDFEAALKSLEEKVDAVITRAVDKIEQLSIKGAISSDLATAPKDKGWDSGAAIKAVKEWASNTDGEIDFAKYKKAFMWVDSAEADKQGGYKLPFADIVDGEPKAVWNGVKAIMSVLNGGRGGVDIPEEDKKSVYRTVVKYYKKFDEEAPELNSKSLTLDNDNGNNKDMKTSSSNEPEKKDLGEGSDGGGDLTPRQQAGNKKGYAMADSLHDVADTLKAHSDALNGHAETMKAHSGLIQSKVDVLHKAADYLKDLLDHNGDETSNKPETEPDNDPDDNDGMDKPKKTVEAEAKTVEKKGGSQAAETEAEVAEPDKTEDKAEEPKPEVETETETKPEGEVKVEETAKDAETEAEAKTNETANVETEVKDSGEVKSEETTDGADHKDDTNDEEELVDPDNMTEEQVQKVLDLMNAELKIQKDE